MAIWTRLTALKADAHSATRQDNLQEWSRRLPLSGITAALHVSILINAHSFIHSRKSKPPTTFRFFKNTARIKVNAPRDPAADCFERIAKCFAYEATGIKLHHKNAGVAKVLAHSRLSLTLPAGPPAMAIPWRAD